MVEKITRAYDKTCDVCMFIASCLVLGALLLIFAQVVLRYAFLTAISWAEETARYAILAGMCLGVSVTSKVDGLAKISIFFDRLQPMVKYYVSMLFNTTILLITGTMVWQGIKVTISRADMSFITINLSSAYIYAFIPICGLLLMFSTIVKMLHCKKPTEEKQ